MSRAISFGERLAELAAVRPGDLALVLVEADGEESSLTWEEFDKRTNQVARLMQSRGVSPGSTVVVGFPNTIEHFLATWAAWKCGAMVLPLNHRAPAAERDSLLALAAPALVCSDWDDIASLHRSDLRHCDDWGTHPVTDVVAQPGKAVGSGGSTGQPKIIIDPSPWARDPEAVLGDVGIEIGFQSAQVQLVPGPVFHNLAFTWSHCGLFAGQRVVVMARFDAHRMLESIQRHRAEFLTLVPTMMRRVADLPEVSTFDLSSLHGVLHSGAPCPPSVKETWLQLVEPHILIEGFGATENVGITLIRGDEWLAHRGSVGRPYRTEVRILDEAGAVARAGEVGEIYMRPIGNAAATYHYLGAVAAPSTEDGFVSLGDCGWLDEAGYLFVADRRVDLILSGGSNVYPAEIESTLTTHPDVADVVVIGLPDEEWGKRVHAVIAPRDLLVPPDAAALREHCRTHLAPYKVPKTFEFLPELPRDDAGKIRRRALVEERSL